MLVLRRRYRKVVEPEPKKEGDRKQLIEHIENPFPDLQNKYVRRVTPPAESAVQVVGGHVVPEVTTGDGAGGSSITRGDLGFGDTETVKQVKLPLRVPVPSFELNLHCCGAELTKFS